jgi:hypothetical protein
LRERHGVWSVFRLATHRFPSSQTGVLTIPKEQELANLPLSDDEQNVLEECEQQIKEGLDTFLEVGRALLIVRDRWPYRVNHRKFEDYRKSRWYLAERQVNQLVQAMEER